MTGGQHANRLAEGLTWLDGVAAQLRRDLVDDTMQLQTQAAVSRDWAAQVAIETARCRARLLLVGAPRHGLPGPSWVSHPLERVLRDAPCDVAIFRAGGVDA